MSFLENLQECNKYLLIRFFVAYKLLIIGIKEVCELTINLFQNAKTYRKLAALIITIPSKISFIQPLRRSGST